MKRITTFLSKWSGTILTTSIIILVGTLFLQSLSATTDQLKHQQKTLELMDANSKLKVENAVLNLRLRHSDEIINQQNSIIKNMYDRLRQWENLPPYPDEENKERPSRSDA